MNCYAKKFSTEQDERWFTFAGHALIAGVLLELSLEEITEYVFETYHHLSIEDEVPQTFVEVFEDMRVV